MSSVSVCERSGRVCAEGYLDDADENGNGVPERFTACQVRDAPKAAAVLRHERWPCA